LKSSGVVDLAKLKSLIDWLLAFGIHGIAPLGRAGLLP
jgi:dihydrodipicolinate synthase/N-acetylneuraminate lyase